MTEQEGRADELSTELGQRIRALRLAKGLTQESLAEAADISVSYLSMIERGERMPHLLTLDAIAAALGDRLGEFFDCERAAGK